MTVRKRFGQHFLHDQQIIDRIVSSLNPRPGETLIEIGPGRGALTTQVLRLAEQLDVIEVDRDLAAAAKERFGQHGELRVHEGDALKIDFSQFGNNLRVFGNLPYNISTPLLFHLMKFSDHIQDMLFMLQREVVDRMTAKPGNKIYGRLTIMLAAVAEVEALFGVDANAFSPPPRVDSAMVRLVPHRSPPFAVPDPSLFADLVRIAFSYRRKTLRNALSSLATVDDIENAGQDPSLRPENIAPEGYALIAQAIINRRQA